MRYFAALLLLLALPAQGQEFVTADIDNFWKAYDKIRATRDSVQQYAYINEYIANGTPGLHAMMQARHYTAQEYVEAINNYPAFWKSVRPNTARAKDFATEISKEVGNLRKLYPALKPANIYFTVGALRSGGTTLNGMVLIGSEIALADEHTQSSEFPERLGHLPYYFEGNPVNDVVFLNVHEYIHTQQRTTIGNTALAQCVIEGVAEFLAVKAMQKPSPTPAVQFGPKRNGQIKERFAPDMHNPLAIYDWMWNSMDNEFGVRDLGYYIGYAICERYYDKAKDKLAAINDMINLDYNNPDALAAFTDASGYFDRPVLEYRAQFEEKRPRVTGTGDFANNKTVKPGKMAITVHFSAPMHQRYRNFELGPLGEDSLLRLTNAQFSEDGRSITLETDLLPGKRYQLELGYQFRDTEGRPLVPYLVDFTTSQ